MGYLFFNFKNKMFIKFQIIIYLFYSKLYRKSISENRLQLYDIKNIAKIRKLKVENFTLNPFILDNFTYNMEQLIFRFE